MKKNSVMMNGAYFAPSCPMLAIAISFRTNSTSASTAPAKPPGALPSRCRRSRPRAAIRMTRNTIAAAIAM